MIPYYFRDFDYKINLIHDIFKEARLFQTQVNFLVPQSISILFRASIVLIYILLAIRMWLKNKEAVRRKTLLSGHDFRQIYIWITALLSLSLLLSIEMLILTVNGIYQFSANLAFHRTQFLLDSMGICFLILNCSLFIFPEILYGLPRHTKSHPTSPVADVEQQDELPETPGETNVNRMQLSGEYVEKIKLLISCYLLDKPFLCPDFNLTMMSLATNIPIHHLSYYFNTILQVSFADWRNRLRVEHAIQMIKDGFAKEHSLNAVSLESGFISQVTFIRAFKNHTGQTPGEHVKIVN